MATGKALEVKPCAENPHVWSNEKEPAWTAMPKRGLLFCRKILSIIIVVASLAAAFAEEITAEQSQIAVSAWMRKYGSITGKTVLRIETIEDLQTGAKFHVAVLRGGGFVVTSADDRVLPIMAYSETGTLVNDKANPLLRLLQSDASTAKEMFGKEDESFMVKDPKTRLFAASATTIGRTDAQKEWDDLLGRTMKHTASNTRLFASANQMTASSQNAYTETRVKPLLKTVWGQTTHNNSIENSLGGDGLLCFNYYTPEWPVEPMQGTTASGDGVDNANGDDKRYTTHYPCGCVATAGAQIMKRWRKPTRFSFGNMPDNPKKRPSETQRKAIGELTADIGQKCKATYGPKTSMSTSKMVENLKSSYSYKGAFWQSISGEDLSVSDGERVSVFDKQVIPNLIAGCPVSMSIDEKGVSGLGHSVVVDGLQYVNNTRAVHVNCGWNGDDDTWYVPPIFSTSNGMFNRVIGIGINIHPTEKKAIIAGRVAAVAKLNGVLTRLNGGLKGASVVLRKNGSRVNGCSTDAHGQFSFLVDGGTYELEISKSGFEAKTVSNVIVTCDDRTVSNWYDEISLNSNVERVKTPVISAQWNMWSMNYEVSISCDTPGAVIYYTTDGSVPTGEESETNKKYTGIPFSQYGSEGGGRILYARAFKDGMVDSEISVPMNLRFYTSEENAKFQLALMTQTTTGSLTMNNASATKESGEPVHSVVGKAGGASMWVSFIAPEDGDYTFAASGYAEGNEDYSLDTQLAVYTGNSVDALTLVAANDDVNAAEYDMSSKLAFRATKGVAYKIAVDTRNGEKGTINLEWKEGREDVASPEECVVYCSAEGGTYSIPIHSTAAWNVCDGSDWISVKKTSGANGESLIFEVPAMTEEGTRTGVLLVCAGEDGPSSTIKIVQEDLIFYNSPIDARSVALAQGKMLFALYGGDWCGWCGVVKRYLKSLGAEFTGRYVLYYNSIDTNFKSIGGYDMPGAGGSPTYAVFDPRTFDYTRGFNGYRNSARLSYGSGGNEEWVQAVLDAAWSAWQTRNAAPIKVEVAGAGGAMLQSTYAGAMLQSPYAIAATFPDGTVASLTNAVSWSIVSGSAATISETGVLSPIAGCSGKVVLRGSAVLWGRQYTEYKTVYVFDKSSAVGFTVSGPELIDLYDAAGGRYTATITCRDGMTMEVTPDWSVDGKDVYYARYAQMSWQGELSFWDDKGSVYQCATATVTAAYGDFTNTMQTVIYGPGYVKLEKYDIPQNAVWPGSTFTVKPKTVRWWRHGVLEEPTDNLKDVVFYWYLYCPGDKSRSGIGTEITVPADAISTNGTCEVDIYARPDRKRYYNPMAKYLGLQFCASRPQAVTVTFDANGGEASYDSLKCVPDKPYGRDLLPALTRKGYRDLGWYTEREGGTIVRSTNCVPAFNTTLYAHWSAHWYNLKFDACGGEGEMSDLELRYDSAKTLPPCKFTRENYAFVGWAFSPNGAVAYQDRQEVINLRDSDGTETLYAVWKKIEIKSPVVGLSVSGPNLIDLYDEDGGHYKAVARCEDGSTVEVAPKWSVSSDDAKYINISATGVLYFNRDTVYQCATATVTAAYGNFTNTMQTVIYGPGYVKLEEYDIPQNAVWPGSTFTVKPKTVRWWRHGVLEEPTDNLKDVVFYWRLYCPGDKSRSGIGTEITVPADAISTNGTCEVDIYARPDRERYYCAWGKSLRPQFCTSRPQTVTVTFNANGGEASYNLLKCVPNKPYGSGCLPALTRKGYDGDWYTERESGTKVTSTNCVPAVNTTLYAHWWAKYYYLKFNANGGDGEMAWQYQYLTYDSEATILKCTYTRAGYTFAGWALSPDGKVAYKDRQSVVNLLDTYGTIDLYAVWQIKANDTVIFNANGGSLDAASSVASIVNNTAIGDMPEPVRKGYKFLGWFTAKKGGAAVTAETVVTGDMTVYAHWTAAWQVTFNANGGKIDGAASVKVMVQKGKAVGTLPKATKSGYSFKGWYTKKSKGLKISAKTKIKKNITYYAQWTAKKYTVTLKKSGSGKVSGGGKKAYKSKITLKATASKGYVFSGWYLDDVLKSKKATWKTTVPLNGATYTAVFTKKTAKKTSAANMVVEKTASAVVAFPAWAVGTFKGKGTFNGKDADVTLTVGKTGKISGKFVSGGKAYAFTAASFEEYGDDGILRTSKGTMKVGKKTYKVEVAVGEAGAEIAVLDGEVEIAVGVVSG